MVNPVTFGPLRPIEERTAIAVRKDVPPAPKAAEPAAPSVPLSKLTTLARDLADSGPPVDYARIAQIRQAISLGSYKVDAEAIADAMQRHYQLGKS